MKGAVFLVLMLMNPVFAGAQSNQAIFDKANSHLKNGELSQSMELYRQIEQSGNVSGALFLNMGITALQLDSLGLAKYYFLRAADFEITESRAQNALAFVASKFSRQSATLPKLPWDRAVEWLIEVPTSFTVFVLGFLLVFGGLILLYLQWLRLFRLKNNKAFVATLVITGIAIISLSFYVDYVDQRYDEAVMIADSHRVLQSPNEQSNLVSIAYEGYNLTIDRWKSDNGWFYIRLGNGQFGWTRTDGVKVL